MYSDKDENIQAYRLGVAGTESAGRSTGSAVRAPAAFTGRKTGPTSIQRCGTTNDILVPATDLLNIFHFILDTGRATNMLEHLLEFMTVPRNTSKNQVGKVNQNTGNGIRFSRKRNLSTNSTGKISVNAHAKQLPASWHLNLRLKRGLSRLTQQQNHKFIIQTHTMHTSMAHDSIGSKWLCVCTVMVSWVRNGQEANDHAADQ